MRAIRRRGHRNLVWNGHQDVGRAVYRGCHRDRACDYSLVWYWKRILRLDICLIEGLFHLERLGFDLHHAAGLDPGLVLFHNLGLVVKWMICGDWHVDHHDVDWSLDRSLREVGQMWSQTASLGKKHCYRGEDGHRAACPVSTDLVKLLDYGQPLYLDFGLDHSICQRKIHALHDCCALGRMSQ